MSIEFNLGLVAGSLSSLKPLPLFRRFGSTLDSKYKESTGDTQHELHGVHKIQIIKSGGKKKPSGGMGTTILAETVNESQEHIFTTSA
jgi:hypothetical protein